MKLRNKKTGEIKTTDKVGLLGRNGKYVWSTGEYDSLAELIEDWEDYKPAEPLIKDELARAIIKSWYGKNNLVGKLRSYGSADWLGLRGSNSAGIDWKIELRVSYKNSLKYDELYSLTELIGEEEE